MTIGISPGVAPQRRSRRVTTRIVRVAHDLQHTHACRFHLWGWTSPTEPPVDLGEQSLQIMDVYTMDLSRFTRLEYIRMTDGIVHLSTDEGASS